MLPSGEVVWAPYGNFGRRLASLAIDWLGVGTLSSWLMSELWWAVFWWLPMLAYMTATVARGRTIGMKITGIRIAHEDSGAVPGFWTAFLR